MSCPTCSHTMQNLGAEGQRIFWCPRCGTLKEYSGPEFFRVELPAWLRRVGEVANFTPGSNDSTQHTTIEATFKVDKFASEAPRIELQVYDAAGRRAI